MTPGDPVPEKLMGLRMSWINKLEKKTEKVIRVMNMQDSPEKEHELNVGCRRSSKKKSL